jgi:hypothetical protein
VSLKKQLKQRVTYMADTNLIKLARQADETETQKKEFNKKVVNAVLQEAAAEAHFRDFYQRLEAEKATPLVGSSKKEVSSQSFTPSPVPVNTVASIQFGFDIGGGFLSWIDDVLASVSEATRDVWSSVLAEAQSTNVVSDSARRAESDLQEGPVHVQVQYESAAPQPQPSAPTDEQVAQSPVPQPKPSVSSEKKDEEEVKGRTITVVLPGSVAAQPSVSQFVNQPNKNSNTKQFVLTLGYIIARMDALLDTKKSSCSTEQQKCISGERTLVIGKMVGHLTQSEQPLSSNFYSVFNQAQQEKDSAQQDEELAAIFG